MTPGNNDGEQSNVKKDYASLVSHDPATNEDNQMWIHGAWQILATIEHKVEQVGDCSRRSCEVKRVDLEEGELRCEMCKWARYCSDDCLTGCVVSFICLDWVLMMSGGV